MKKHLLLFAVLVACLITVTPTFAGGKSSNTISTATALSIPTQNIPLVGSFANGAFAGTFSIVQFIQSGGAIMAVGNLTGTLTDVAGNVIGTVGGTQIQLPVAQIAGNCDELHIELGSSNLDLLGSIVQVDQAGVDISADAGVGSLLCSITSLLNVPLLSFLVVGLLNSLLGVLV
jgi:hypothetical protein